MQHAHLRGLLAVVLLGGLSGCAGLGARDGSFGAQVPLPEIPGPVCAVLERLVPGGEIRAIKQNNVGGELIYHIEARVGEKQLEFDIAHDGTVLATGEGVSHAALPMEVVTAVRRCFGTLAGVRVCRAVEGDEEYYKANGRRNGTVVITLKLTDAGRIIAKEKS